MMFSQLTKDVSIPWTIAIIATFFIYNLNGVPEHFFKHFFIGISAGMIIVLVMLIATNKMWPMWWQLPLWLWVYAMIPDMLHLLGDKGHPEPWMDIFLFHNTIDEALFIEWFLGLFSALTIFIYSNLRKKYV